MHENFLSADKNAKKIMYVIIFIRYLNHTTSNPVQISPVKKQILLPSPRHRSHPLPLNLGNIARCVIKACKLERLQQKITCFPFCLPSGVNPINANLIYQQQIENWNVSLFFFFALSLLFSTTSPNMRNTSIRPREDTC